MSVSGGTATSTSIAASRKPRHGPQPKAPPYGCRITSCNWYRRCSAAFGPTSPSASSCTSPSRRSKSSCRCLGGPRSSRVCWAPILSVSTSPGAHRTFFCCRGDWPGQRLRGHPSGCAPGSARWISATAKSRWARFPSQSTPPNSTRKRAIGISAAVLRRSAPSWATHARSCSASTDSITPRASRFVSRRSPSCSPKAGPSVRTPC